MYTYVLFMYLKFVLSGFSIGKIKYKLFATTICAM